MLTSRLLQFILLSSHLWQQKRVSALMGKLLGDEGEIIGCDLFIMPSFVFSRVIHYLNFVVKFYFFCSSYQKERGFSIQLLSNSIALAKKMRKRLKKKKLLDHVRDK